MHSLRSWRATGQAPATARPTAREGRKIADQLVLLSRDDGDRGPEIIRAFEQRTGLSAAREGERTVFELGPADHSVDIVQTLTKIDPDWSEYVALGDPGAAPDGA